MKNVTRDEYDKALKVVFKYQKQIQEESEKVNKKTNKIHKFHNVSPSTPIWNSNLSSRGLNALRVYFFGRNTSSETYRNHRVQRVDCLSQVSISKLKTLGNTGQKTIEEIKQLSIYSGVKLKK